MNAALWLMAVQGAMGAFDTLYYHEHRARLPSGGRRTRPELILHGLRDFVYAVLFATLPWWSWHGAWAMVLVVMIAAEICLTMADFMVEVKAREPVGVLGGERVTHGLMAIVYGAFLACLLPHVLEWWHKPTAFVAAATGAADAAPAALRVVLSVMAAGVFASGVRDLHAARRS